MEQVAGTQVHNCNNNSTSPRTLHRFTHIMSDKTKEIPRALILRDLLITSLDFSCS